MNDRKSNSKMNKEEHVRKLLQKLKELTYAQPGVLKKVWAEERDEPVKHSVKGQTQDPKQAQRSQQGQDCEQPSDSTPGEQSKQIGRQQRATKFSPKNILDHNPGAREMVERVTSAQPYKAFFTLLKDSGFILDRAIFARNLVALAIAQADAARIKDHAMSNVPSTGVNSSRKRSHDDASLDDAPLPLSNKKQAAHSTSHEQGLEEYSDVRSSLIKAEDYIVEDSVPRSNEHSAAGRTATDHGKGSSSHISTTPPQSRKVPSVEAAQSEDGEGLTASTLMDSPLSSNPDRCLAQCIPQHECKWRGCTAMLPRLNNLRLHVLQRHGQHIDQHSWKCVWMDRTTPEGLMRYQRCHKSQWATLDAWAAHMEMAHFCHATQEDDTDI